MYQCSQEKFHDAVNQVFHELASEGIPWLPISSLTMGAEISRGAFGIVRDAVAELDGEPTAVAVKSLSARLRKSSYVEALADFKTEVRMGWLSSWKARAGKRTTRILRIFGVAYDYVRRGQKVRLRIVMERVNCDGDVHDEIHSEEYWVCLREAGKDTGVSVRNHFVTVDGHDVWAYVMPRELKLRLGLDLARALRELERAKVIHRDIKPSNMLLHQGAPDRPVSRTQEESASALRTRALSAAVCYHSCTCSWLLCLQSGVCDATLIAGAAAQAYGLRRGRSARCCRRLRGRHTGVHGIGGGSGR